MPGMCIHTSCTTLASLGIAGSRKAEFCTKHARAGMVNVRRCGKDGCSKYPSFGAAGSRRRQFCAAHALAGMVDVRSTRCSKEGCPTRPSFGAAGCKKTEFCAAHALAGMVNVRSERCSKEGCSTRPSFGGACSRKAELCAAHARAGMVNVRSKRCSKEGCSTRPSFGAAGSKKTEFCAAHALASMVNVRNKRCSKEGCSTRPSFGAAGSRKAKFCAAHARAGMVDVRSKWCSKEGCSAISSFGAAGSRKAELCATHARARMIYVDSDECASRHHSNLVREHRNSCRGAAQDSIIWSDLMEHFREKNPASGDFVTGEAGVGVDDGCEKSGHSPNAGPNTSDNGRNADSRCNPCVIRDRRRGANSTTTSPAPSRQHPGVAAADRVTIGGAVMRTKIKMEDTVGPARGFEGIRSSKQVAARPSSYDSTGLGGSSRTIRRRSCANSITDGRNTKRLRRTAQVQPILDVIAGDDVMSEDDGTGVKLELNVSSMS